MRPGKGRHPVAEGTSADAAFHIESRGIAPVPEEGRHGNAAELFWLWVGSDLLILFPATGALLTMTGLSFGQAVIAILVGNLSYAVLGLTSLQGPATGTATFTVTRASFGRNGGRGLSGLNWITCVGWEATGVTLVTLSAVAAVEAAGWSHPPAVAKLAILVVTVAALGLLPLLGHQTIVVVQRWVSYLLLAVERDVDRVEAEAGQLGGEQLGRAVHRQDDAVAGSDPSLVEEPDGLGGQDVALRVGGPDPAVAHRHGLRRRRDGRRHALVDVTERCRGVRARSAVASRTHAHGCILAHPLTNFTAPGPPVGLPAAR